LDQPAEQKRRNAAADRGANGVETSDCQRPSLQGEYLAGGEIRRTELAAADAKKKIKNHALVWVICDSRPAANRYAVIRRRTPLIPNVPAIIFLRPMVSKKDPINSGPQKLPIASGTR
jgi:hypothetical protein